MGLIVETFNKYYLEPDGTCIGEFTVEERNFIEELDNILEKKKVEVLDSNNMDMYYKPDTALANYIIAAIEEHRYRFAPTANEMEIFLPEGYIKLVFKDKDLKINKLEGVEQYAN